MSGVLINARQGTGSSMLAKCFAHMGMVMGSRETFWSPQWENHYEHQILTGYADDDPPADAVPGKTTRKKIRYIGKAYLRGHEDGWRSFGVKVTTWFDRRKEILRLTRGWPNLLRVTTLRHPLGNFKRSAKDMSYRRLSEMVETWETTLSTYHDYLDEGWAVVSYPEVWEAPERLIPLIERAGCQWDAEQVPVYDPIHSMSRGYLVPGELERFYKRFPEVQGPWEELLERAMKSLENPV